MNNNLRLGAWMHLPSSFVAEILVRSGFSWCCVDRQHGFADEQMMFECIRTISLAGAEAVVRVESPTSTQIGRALDAGATSIIVPNIRSVEEATAAVSACHFMPDGTRSFAATRSKFYPPVQTACHLMIETKEALNNLDEIADLPGLAGLFVGPSDLALSIGGESEVMVAAKKVAEACHRRGLVPGVFGGNADVEKWVSIGFRFIAVGADSVLLASAAKQANGVALDTAKKALAALPGDA